METKEADSEEEFSSDGSDGVWQSDVDGEVVGDYGQGGDANSH